MKVIFQRERAATLWEELKPLAERHSREQEHHQDIPLDVDIERYVKADEIGILRCYTARNEEGCLIGYAIFLVLPSLRHRTSLEATQDSLYLAPEYRKGLTGVKLLNFIKQSCIGESVQILRQHTHPDSSLDLLMPKLGYEKVHHEWEQRLDKGA